MSQDGRSGQSTTYLQVPEEMTESQNSCGLMGPNIRKL
jgi:hypothetical protein